LIDEEVIGCKEAQTQLEFSFKESVEVITANNNEEQRENSICESSSIRKEKKLRE
jgi:hypothetical protein